VAGGDGVVAEPEAVEGAGLEVLGDDVDLAGEPQHQLPAALVLEVDADAPLVEVVAEERGPDPATERVGHRGQRATTQVAVDGVLDLDDVGAEAGEQLCGERQGLHLLEGEDPHAVERLAVREGRFVHHFAESHGVSVI
jgi:hypothetical protein